MTLANSICNVDLTLNLVVLLELDFNISWQLYKHILNHLKINNADIMCIKRSSLIKYNLVREFATQCFLLYLSQN